MLGLGLKLSRGFRQFVSYIKANRVLDLYDAFFGEDTTILDRSGEGNNATLYTGRFVSTDGVADKAIDADCSAAGSGAYRLTGKVRASSTGLVYGSINGSAVSYSVTAANVWEDFETGVVSGGTPADVFVG